jgi:hypothetical protein
MLPDRLAVFCEGETERDLLDGLRQHWRIAHARVQIVGRCGDPRAVVREARQHRDALAAAERAGTRIWVVFDRDEHHHFSSAIDQARSLGFKVAWSNPCVELFGLLLHGDQRAELDRHDAQRRLAREHPGYDHDKNPRLDRKTVLGNLPAALLRADHINRFAEQIGDATGNPSTRIGELIRSLGRGHLP